MKDKGSLIQWLVCALLAALILGNAGFAVLAQQQRQAQVERIEEHQAVYEEHVEQVQALLDQQQWIVAGASDSYRADAYAPGVDRIAEQQLIAAEYQLVLLQTIAQQNAAIIELMLVAGP